MSETQIAAPIEFKEWPKIPRLRRDITITEKIDGTNAQVYIGEDGTVMAGSRTRWVTPDSDNFGFAAWVEKNKEDLRALGVGRHFGEWWGKGIQRQYGLTERRFSLFNVMRFNETVPQEFKDRMAAIGVGAVPILYTGPFTDDAVDRTIRELGEKGSIAAPGFMNPEGVVVFHKASGSLFKRTFEGDDKPKTVVAGFQPPAAV